MKTIFHHRCRMTAIPTDFLLDPTISAEAKAVASILQALDEGEYTLPELALYLNIPDEEILPVMAELKDLGLVTIEKEDDSFLLNVL